MKKNKLVHIAITSIMLLSTVLTPQMSHAIASMQAEEADNATEVDPMDENAVKADVIGNLEDGSDEVDSEEVMDVDVDNESEELEDDPAPTENDEVADETLEDINNNDPPVEEEIEEENVETDVGDQVKPLAEEAKDLGSNIFKDVNIQINDKVLEPGTNEIEISEDLQLQVTFDWELPDDVDLNSGDWARIKLSDALEGVAGRTTGSLYEGDLEVGTYEITEEGYLRVEFNDELSERNERSGEVGVLLEFDLKEFEEDANQSIKFEDPINKEFIIKAKPGGDVHDIKKSGVANENINPEYLNWTIDINTKLENLTNATVEDIIPEGLELDFDSIEIYELTVGYEGKLTEGNKIDGLDITEIASGFKVDLGETDKAYRIKYKTDITEFKSEFTNDVVLKDEGKEKAKDKYTVTGLERGSLIEKEGWIQNKDQIVWQIDVNKSESSLKNVTVKDDIPAGLDIKEIRVWKLSKSGNNWGYGERLGDYDEFPVDLGDIDGAYRFEVTTDIDYDFFEEYTKELVFDNEAVLEVDGKQEDQDDATVTVKRESLLEKNGWESTEYGDSKISWKISVNKAQHTIKNAVITDSIGAGLELIEDTVKVYDSNNELVDIEGKLEITADGFTINLGDIDSEYRIEYDTKITENLTEGQEGYKNKVGLEGDGLEGDGVEEGDITKEPTIKPSVSNKYEKNRENNKEIDGIKYDGLNYTEKTMSWKLTIDAIKEEITELKITDTFAPEKSMKFIADSLRVIVGEDILVENTDYTLKDNGVDGFELEFIGEHKPLERSKYEIYFKTSFEPNEVIVAGGELNTGNQYTNNVEYTGKTKDVEGNEKEFTEKDDAKYNVKEEYVNSGKKSGSLDRENRTINWEIFANATGQDLTGGPFVITDTLTEGDQTINEDAKVYEFNLGKDGDFIKGDEITEGFAVVYNEDKDGFTLTFEDGVDKPVLVEFSSKINGLSEEWYKNEVKVSDITEQEKTYDAEVRYDRHNQFINKETTNVDGNITYTDDEIDWKISINESLSDIKNAVFKDIISEGLVLVNDSIKVYKDAIAEDNIVDIAEDAITITPNDAGDTELSINLGDIEESRYFITYQTVVVATDGKISNEASLVGEDEQLGNSSKKEYTARQSSWGTGSGKENRGQIEILKVDADTGKLIASSATFELYYFLNGEKQVVTGEVQVTEEGKIQYGNLPFRTYYLKEVEAPEGYVLSNKEIEIEVNKENKEIELLVENIAELEISVVKVWEDAENQDGIRPESITVNLVANGEKIESTTLNEDNDWSTSFTGLSPIDEDGDEIEYTVEEVTVEGYEVVQTGTAEDGYVLTNTHEPELIDLEGTKTWDDVDNQDGKRPESITVRLLANGEEIDYVEATADSDWTFKFTDLPKFKNGEEINYTIQEDGVEDYSTEINGMDITNSYTPEQTSINVVKAWNDAENQDGIRPESVTVKLLANGEETDRVVVLNAENNWQADFTELDVYADGEAIEYTVEEVKVEGYEVVQVGTSEDGYVLTNKHEPERIDLLGTKTWDDADNQDGKRPDTITVRLLANGTEIDNVEVTEETDWTFEFTDLPRFENGVEINYTVQEDGVEDYSTEIDGMDITNSYTPEQTSINVVKAWDDAENQDGIRPESVTVKLLANGEETDRVVALNAENNWQADFTELDVYADGEEIEYTIEEVAVTGYEVVQTGTSEDGYVLTNKHTPEVTEVSITKEWNDEDDLAGFRPDHIEVELYADGEATGKIIAITADEEGAWKGSFINLPKYRDEGVQIDYTVKEISLDEDLYSVEVIPGEEENDEKVYDFTLINTHEVERFNFNGTKIWDDANNQDGKRPDSITVRLLANGEEIDYVEITAEDDWKYSFTGLPRFENGEEINYTVQEDEVEGYSTEINGTEITNHYTPGKTSINVVKAWNDKNNVADRPDSITINLFANGEKIDSVELNAKNNWQADFMELDEYKDGKKIVYTVTEDKVKGFVTESIKGNADDGFIITNRPVEDPEKPEDPDPKDPSGEDPKTPEEPEESEEPKDDSVLPKTGEAVSYTLLAVVLIGLGFGVVFYKRKRTNE